MVSLRQLLVGLALGVAGFLLQASRALKLAVNYYC